MGAGAENQGRAMSEARVQELEAELARVKAQLRTTVERHEASMEEVREKERFIEQLAELTPVVITVFDLDTQHDTYISPDVVNLHGYTPDELARMKDLFSDLLHPEDVATVREHFARLKWAGDDEVRELEYRIRHRDGEWRWLRSRHLPFARDDQGEVRQVVTATLDITERKHAELALCASEERFRSYFELGLIGMAITSPEKGIVEVNDKICRILGYERDELLRMTWAELTHPDDLAADVVHFKRVIAGEIDGYALDKRWIHKDGRVIDTKISVKALRRADGSVDYFVALLEDTTERKRAEEVLREAHDELERRVAKRTEQLSIANEDLKKEIIERKRVEEERRQLLHRIIFAQEDERRRIARDLHDHFGQQVTTLILQLSLLKTANGATEAQREHISTLETVAKQFDADIDFLVRELRPTALDDLGLQAALTSHVKAWSKHSGVRAEFHASGMEKDRLTSEIETTLYRIVQEALNNVAKHARAGKVDILLERRADSVSLIIEDNGVGFDPAKIHGAGNGGFGLTGMRERAALASGTVVIEARPGKGVTVIARIPAPHVTSGGEMA